MKNEKILILMATYNGGQNISDQIESLLSQTIQDWNLVIHDDGSSDNTLKIISSYSDKYPEKITLLNDHKKGLGPALNFAHLLERTKADYYFFCDQDDIWKPTKIELTMKKMKFAEKKYGKDIPLLVHTDLTVVDDKLHIISKSFWKNQRLDPMIGNDPNKILFHNVVTGCTMAINKKAKKISTPIPKEAIIHDYWIALNVAKFGKMVFLPEQTVLYRQHGKNSIGAKNIHLFYFLSKLYKFPLHFKRYLTMFYRLPYKPNYMKAIFSKLVISLPRMCKNRWTK